MKKLGYLGPPGTFGEQAALRYDATAELTPEPSNGAIVFAVAKREVDEGIVPIENSLDGAIPETLDALLRSDGLLIKAELNLPVRQHLIAAQGTRLEDIRVVVSHPAALAQCRAYLETRLSAARLEAALSTSAAVVKAVATPGYAAIGTIRAAELAGGEVIAEAIQDNDQNKTRFVVLGYEDSAPSGDDKTSFAFTTAHDEPGSLLRILNELSSRAINMTRIESRPSREELGVYIFLIDCQGHRQDPAVKAALASVEAKAHYFRLFGSYPRHQEQPPS